MSNRTKQIETATLFLLGKRVRVWAGNDKKTKPDFEGVFSSKNTAGSSYLRFTDVILWHGGGKAEHWVLRKWVSKIEVI